ncbi:MAG: TetR/AcrR family transcriptional regulator, partial [Candidatus Binataceae bacterium]
MAGPARKPRQRGVSTRERILAQAGRLFASRGFNGVTMPAIADASGIAASAIYKHFTSKAELFFQVVRRAVEEAQAPPGSQLADTVAGYTTRRLRPVRQM